MKQMRMPPFKQRGNAALLEKLLTQQNQLQPFWDAVDNIDEAPVDVFVLGNSISQGLLLADYDNNWLSQTANSLTGTYGPNATHGRGFLPATTGGGTNGWTLTNTSGQSSATPTTGWGLWAVSIGVGDQMAITETFDYLTIAYSKFATLLGGLVFSGALEVRVDGNIVGTIDTRDATVPANDIDSGYSQTFGPFTLGSHSVQVFGRTGQGGGIARVATLEGAFAHKGNANAGFRFWNGGHAGFSLDTFNGSARQYEMLGRSIVPDLVIIQEMYNDRTVDVPTYSARLASAITNVQAQTSAPIILVSEYQTRDYTTAGRWEGHRAEMEAQAESNGLTYLDLGGMVGSLGFNGVLDDPCSFLADNHHPGQTGHDYIADVYTAFLPDETLIANWCP